MSTPLHVTVNLDRQPWTDVGEARVGRLARVGLAPGLTNGGRSGVLLLVVTDDGAMVVAHTTWRLFNMAAKVFAASPSVLLEAEEGP